jgi:hypothetical protein
MILYANKRYTDEEVYNYIVVTGEGSQGPPVRGFARDENPYSPTYYLGEYGMHVLHIQSSMVTTAAQAGTMARAELNLRLGKAERIHFNSIVNPAHEHLDVIQIQRAKSKIDSIYMIDSMTIPLVPVRALDVMTRERIAQLG